MENYAFLIFYFFIFFLHGNGYNRLLVWLIYMIAIERDAKVAHRRIPLEVSIDSRSRTFYFSLLGLKNQQKYGMISGKGD